MENKVATGDSICYYFTRYYPVLGQNINQIPEENQETFKNNMKMAFLK